MNKRKKESKNKERNEGKNSFFRVVLNNSF